jgi:hypothetical protein
MKKRQSGRERTDRVRGGAEPSSPSPSPPSSSLESGGALSRSLLVKYGGSNNVGVLEKDTEADLRKLESVNATHAERVKHLCEKELEAFEIARNRLRTKMNELSKDKALRELDDKRYEYSQRVNKNMRKLSILAEDSFRQIESDPSLSDGEKTEKVHQLEIEIFQKLSDMQSKYPSAWLVAFGLWLVACGLWLVACGLWLVACGL